MGFEKLKGRTSQRIEADYILHFKVSELSIRPLGVDHVPFAIAKHPRGHALVVKVGIIKVAQHRFTGCQIYGPIVERSVPAIKLRLVAFGTLCACREY